MTSPLKRRQDDQEQAAFDQLNQQLVDAAKSLGFVITEFNVARSMLDPQQWTTISIRLTKARSSRRSDIISG